jgi:transcriptional regulator with XRE-family HTH domain
VSTPREQLAEVLKTARVEAGFDSHGALAKRLTVSRPVISRAENPAQPVPSDALLAAWSGATGVPLDQLTDLSQRAKSGTPDWFMPYLTAEQNADTLRFWGPLLVPGLLQTEGYARGVLSGEPYTAEQLAYRIDARVQRQKVIGKARITAAIDYRVLSRPMGTPAVMAEQCSHLIALVEDQSIRLHVVPEGGNVGLGGAHAIASTDGVSMVSLTTSVQDMTSTASDVVKRTLNLFDVILGASLPAIQSHEYVRNQEETWKAQI